MQEKKRWKQRMVLLVIFTVFMGFSTIVNAEEISIPSQEENEKAILQGWQGTIEEGNRCYYDETGKIVTGLQVIEEKTYYFNEKGMLQNGWNTVDDNTYYFSLENGERYESGEFVIDEKMYLFDGDGKFVLVEEKKTEEVTEEKKEEISLEVTNGFRGWHWDGGWYYYKGNGEKYKGWLKDAGKWYYLDGNNTENIGKMVANSRKIINGRTYFFNGSGVMQTGWMKFPEGWYYADAGGVMKTGWIKLGKYWYYLDKTNTENPGLMVSNCKKEISNRIYCFTKSGEMQTGWVKCTEGWYYFDSNGEKQTGWIKLGRYWYYLDKKHMEFPGLMVANATKQIGKYIYTFRSDGRMITGWNYVRGKGYHYYDNNGAKKSGWVLVNRKWYYMDPVKDGIMVAAKWKWLNNKYYYLYADGAMATRWLYVGGNYYYMSTDGTMRTGWQYISGNWYYFYPKNDSHGWGVMAKNTTINGWKIGADGVMLTPERAAMSSKAQMYSSNTGYLILVNRAKCKVGVFSGSNRSWNMVKYWDCAPGKPSTPTVSGAFKVGSKGYYFDSGSARCYWFTQFYGNYLFHSVLYNRSGGLADGRVGLQLSHGCVRLQIDNAKWIYDNIPRGTAVIVY